MVMTVRPGVYAIRNSAHAKSYLTPHHSSGRAGTRLYAEHWRNEGLQKWNVQYNSRSGAYVIENFGHAGVFLTIADSSRRYVPHAEINSYVQEWVIHEAPSGHGFYIIKSGEQDQVLEVESGGFEVSVLIGKYVRVLKICCQVLVNDRDPPRTPKRQIWYFEAD
ncbi:hypothetical protein EYR40_003474 [Pleurotus pulmonarius]|nr:hypothetical protein EYR40_003474 [Pleurotus pulmonarius]